jgi:hypothetical protein
VNTNKPYYTQRHVKGFRDRLNKIFDAVYLPKRGRLVKIASLFGMSVPGTKNCLDNDRPPKQKKAFDSLLTGLEDLIVHRTPCRIKREQLIEYLLQNGDYPLSNKKNYAALSIDKKDTHPYQELHGLIFQISELLDIRIGQNIHRSELIKIFELIFLFCLNNIQYMTSSDMREIVEISLKSTKSKT